MQGLRIYTYGFWHSCSTHHTAGQGAGLIKAHDADASCWPQLGWIQHSYALLLQLVDAGCIGTDAHGGTAYGHCCNQGVNQPLYGISWGPLMGCAPPCHCNHKHAQVKDEGKAIETPQVLQVTCMSSTSAAAAVTALSGISICRHACQQPVLLSCQRRGAVSGLEALAVAT